MVLETHLDVTGSQPDHSRDDGNQAIWRTAQMLCACLYVGEPRNRVRISSVREVKIFN